MNRTMALVAAAATFLAGCQAHGPRASANLRAIPVPLDAADPARDHTGALRYLGGLQLTSTDPRFGELSALRWDNGTLIVVTDNARVIRLRPLEQGGRLVGAELLSIAMLRGSDGSPLTDEAENDSEGLTRDGKGGWLVSFEGDHRILRYRRLGDPAVGRAGSPVELLGPLEENHGVEAIAGNAGALFACAERTATTGNPNCVETAPATPLRRIAVSAPEPIASLGGVPTDADADDRGRRYVLFRSFSSADGSGAAIVRVERDGRTTPLAVLRPPSTLDNMEGLAVRQEGGATVLYLLSDDNGAREQRTLLLKFRVEE